MTTTTATTTGTGTAITHVRVFDGERVLDADTVVIQGREIVAVGGPIPDGAEVVDGTGATLLPGLIDSHVHTSRAGLALALRFGVTTELEMQGLHTRDNRAEITEDDTIADVRSAGFGITPPGGHPSELIPPGFRPENQDRTPVDPARTGRVVKPFASTPEEVVRFIPELVATGSDYLKFMIDDGTVEGSPGLPTLDGASVAAGVAEAHRLGLLTVAHALTVDATRTAIEAGIDGLAHLFMDRPHSTEIIELIAGSGAFVVPCVVLNSSMMGIAPVRFAADPRVGSRLDPAWLELLHGSYNRYPQGKLDDVLGSVRALHEAGVDLLAGTDVAPTPLPFLGGMAHGASLHHELRLLVDAGLTPVHALRAATSVPARRFGLDDRGRIAAGQRADLVLVHGDPTVNISDTLNIAHVWRRGTRLADPGPADATVLG